MNSFQNRREFHTSYEFLSHEQLLTLDLAMFFPAQANDIASGKSTGWLRKSTGGQPSAGVCAMQRVKASRRSQLASHRHNR
jgi:hypothetical protein